MVCGPCQARRDKRDQALSNNNYLAAAGHTALGAREMAQKTLQGALARIRMPGPSGRK